jgi:hypothetical protein
MPETIVLGEEDAQRYDRHHPNKCKHHGDPI